jgi:hypothetical protein
LLCSRERVGLVPRGTAEVRGYVPADDDASDGLMRAPLPRLPVTLACAVSLAFGVARADEPRGGAAPEGVDPRRETRADEAAPGDEIWAPVTAGPFVAMTAPLPPVGRLTLQPLLFLAIARGEYLADGTYEALPGSSGASSLAAELFLEYGLSKRVSVGGQLTGAYNRAREGENEEDALGLGETLVFGRYALFEEGRLAPAATLLAQLKLPTGRHESKDPTRLGVDVLGTGTWDAAFGVSLTKGLRPVVAHLDLLLTIPATTATVEGREHRYGPWLLWSAAVELPVLQERAALMLELTGLHLPDERIDGRRAADTQVNELQLGFGVQLIFSEAVQLLAGYQRLLWGTNATAHDILGLTVVPLL